MKFIFSAKEILDDTILWDTFLHQEWSGVAYEEGVYKVSVREKSIAQPTPIFVEENSEWNLNFDIGILSDIAFTEIRERIKQLLQINDQYLQSSWLWDIDAWETIFTVDASQEATTILSYWIPKIEEKRIWDKKIRKFLGAEVANLDTFRKALSFQVTQILEGIPQEQLAQDTDIIEWKKRRNKEVRVKKEKPKNNAVPYTWSHIRSNYMPPERVEISWKSLKDFYVELEKMIEEINQTENTVFLEDSKVYDPFTKHGVAWIDKVPLETRLQNVASLEAQYKKMLVWEHEESEAYTPREFFAASQWNSDTFGIEIYIIKTYMDAGKFDKVCEFFLFLKDVSWKEKRRYEQFGQDLAGKDLFNLLHHMKRIMGIIIRTGNSKVKNIGEVKEMFLEVFLDTLREKLPLMAARFSRHPYEKRLFWLKLLPSVNLSKAQEQALNEDDGLDMIYEICQTLFLILWSGGRKHTQATENIFLQMLLIDLPEGTKFRSKNQPKNDLFSGTFRKNVGKQWAGLLQLMRH